MNALHASWEMNPEEFEGLWQPLPDAVEFHLMSCYVTLAGWQALAHTLLENPNVQGTLVFSLSGVAPLRQRDLLLAFQDFVQKQGSHSRIRVFLVHDKAYQLFHPKAHACRSPTRVQVVVGSANLTGAGQRTNMELMSVVEGNYALFGRFLDSVNSLIDTNHLIRLDGANLGSFLAAVDGWTDSTDSDLGSSSPPSSGVGGSGPYGSENPPEPPFDPLDFFTLDDTEDDPISPEESHRALQRIGALASQGIQIARRDETATLSVSISLLAFREAGILPGIEKATTAKGISFEDKNTVTFHLLPEEIRDKREALMRPLGQLYGRYCMGMLGCRWMPKTWWPVFQKSWEDIENKSSLVNLRGNTFALQKLIEEHLIELHQSVEQENGALYIGLKKRFYNRINPPSKWKDSAGSLLGIPYSEPNPKELTPEVRELVISGIRQNVATSVLPRLRPELPLAMLEGIGLRPTSRPFYGEQLDAGSALQLIAQWTHAGVMPFLQRGSATLSFSPSRNLVAEALTKRFDATERELVAHAYQNANRWLALSGDPGRAWNHLAEAWEAFSWWFKLETQDINWDEYLPASSS